jgi:hypothetical protein
MKLTAIIVLILAAVATASDPFTDTSLRGGKPDWAKGPKPGKGPTPGGNGNGAACGTYKNDLANCPVLGGCKLCMSPGAKPKEKCVSDKDASDPAECLQK